MPDPVGQGGLAGKEILLTRSAGAGRGTAAALEALGVRVVCRSTIELVAPRDPQPARRAVQRLAEYDWIVFTSANGVRFFFEVWEQQSGDARAPQARIAAIGPATARALKRRNWLPALVAGKSDSAGLSDVLARHLVPEERVLLVRPEVAQEVLPAAVRAAGAQVDAVAFYRNVAAPHIGEIVQEIVSGRYHAVVFTAPSALQRLLECDASGPALEAALRLMPLVAIGDVTAEAVNAAGLAVAAVAAEPTDQGIVEALTAVFHDRD
jgi:uroporphyrinogen III methyltransferase/synthase